MSRHRFVRFAFLPAVAMLFMLSSGCAQKQLTAQEAREKYGSPYSRPQLLTRTKKKLPPVPIDPSLQSSGSPFEAEPNEIQTASHATD